MASRTICIISRSMWCPPAAILLLALLAAAPPPHHPPTSRRFRQAAEEEEGRSASSGASLLISLPPLLLALLHPRPGLAVAASQHRIPHSLPINQKRPDTCKNDDMNDVVSAVSFIGAESAARGSVWLTKQDATRGSDRGRAGTRGRPLRASRNHRRDLEQLRGKNRAHQGWRARRRALRLGVLFCHPAELSRHLHVCLLELGAWGNAT